MSLWQTCAEVSLILQGDVFVWNIAEARKCHNRTHINGPYAQIFIFKDDWSEDKHFWVFRGKAAEKWDLCARHYH